MNFCSNCGTKLDENARFCPTCGAQVAAPQQAQAQPQAQAQTQNTTYNATVFPEAEQENTSSSILKNGIVALCLPWFPIASIVAIILGAGVKKKAKEYQNKFGLLNGKARAGSILGNLGFGFGIGMTVFYGIYFLFLISIILSALG